MSVGILGGGLGGLSAAYYLLQSSTKYKPTIIEASNVVGGWIKSINDPELNILFEKGPRTFRPKGLQGLNALCLVEDLKLTDRVIPISKDHPTARNRMIYAKNRLHILPSSISGMFKTYPPFSKPIVFALLKDFFSPKKVLSDESIYSFVERRLGKDLADYAISPMICGICAGDAKEISVKFLMSSLFEAEQKYGSIAKGIINGDFFKKQEYPSYIKDSELCKRVNQEKWSVWYLEGGCQQLTDALNENIQGKGATVSFKSPCTKLNFQGGQVSCQIGDKEQSFKHLISSLSAKTLALLLSEQHPILSKELKQIPMVTVAVINVAFKGNHLKENAFGFLVPPIEKLPLLGVVYDSCNFSYNDMTVLTVMMGGRWFGNHFGPKTTTNEIAEKALEQISNILGIKQQPDKLHVSILKDCIPQYVVGHHERVDRIFKYIKDNNVPLSLVGSSFGGVSLNEVIMSSKIAVEKLQ